MHTIHEDDETSASAMSDAAQQAHTALQELLAQCCRDLGLQEPPEELPPLQLTWEPDRPPTDLAQQLIRQLKQTQTADSVIVAGHIFCYHCESATCEHSRPAAPGEIFAGYANNGTPIWQEFLNELLALSEQRVDRLFDSRPSVLARLVSRKHLLRDQTVAYGRTSMMYRIIAQVIAGYFTIGDTRCAMTVQIVETADHALHVQVIQPTHLAEHLADAQEPRSLLYRVNDSIAKLRRLVRRQQSQWQGQLDRAARIQVKEKLISMLRRLINSIEQRDRQKKRRTRHAEQRASEQRPIHKATEDVAAASASDFYDDTVRKSKVVVGRAGRCHIFNEKGRHITSLLLPGDKLDNRRRKKRYVPLPAEEVNTLRPAILDHASD